MPDDLIQNPDAPFAQPVAVPPPPAPPAPPPYRMMDTLPPAELVAEPLSDGRPFPVVPGMDPRSIPAQREQMEWALSEHYTKQAREKGQPVAPPGGSRIYSGTRWFPNNALGQAHAYANMYGPGDWLNQNVWDPILAKTGTGPGAEGAVGGAASTAARVPLNLVGGTLDVPGTLFNVGKHAVLPGAGTTGDAPSIAQGLYRGTGTPELPASASTTRQFAEAALPMLLTEGVAGTPLLRALGRTAAYTAGGMGGSWLGGELGDYLGNREMGQTLGSFLPVAPSLLRLGLQRSLAQQFRAPDAAETYRAGQELGIQPSFTSMATPEGQSVATTLGSVPLLGGPVRAANTRMKETIQGARDQAAEMIAGPEGYIPAQITPETIGQTVTQGAQQAMSGGPEALATEAQRANAAAAGQNWPQSVQELVRQQLLRPDLQTQIARLFNPINEALNRPDRPNVDVSPIVTGTQEALQNRATGTTRSLEDAARAQLGELTNASTISDRPHPEFQGPMPEGSIYAPWNLLKNWRTTVGNRLPNVMDIAKQQLGPMKAIGSQLMEQHADTIAGLGDAWRAANQALATRLGPALEYMKGLGGEPLGTTGKFEEGTVPGEAQASRAVTSNLYSPEKLKWLTNAATFPEQAWRNLAAQLVGRLGNTVQGGFRPEHFYDQWIGGGRRGSIGEGVRTALTTVGSGYESSASPMLDAAAQLAKSFSPQQERRGLANTAGAAYGVHKMLELMGRGAEAVAGPVVGAAAPAVGYRMLAGSLESPSMARAMAGMPVGGDIARAVGRTGLAGALTNAIHNLAGTSIMGSPAYDAAKAQRDQEIIARDAEARRLWAGGQPRAQPGFPQQ